MQPQTENKQLLLVYFKVRGKLQAVRNLLSYLSIPFLEVHLEDNQSKRKLPPEVKLTLRSIKIDINSLPLLIDDGLMIYETLPIMNYLCRKFNQEDLMGSSIRQRAQVNELVDIILTKEPLIMGDIFKLAEQSVEKCREEINNDKVALYEKIMLQSGYITVICQLLHRSSQSKSFIFGNPTLVDFFFLETCHYILGAFSSINEKKVCALHTIIKGIFKFGKREPEQFKYFKVMEGFLEFIYNQPFYTLNRQYLESFTIICPQFNPEKVKGIRKIWTFNNKFVK